MIGTRNPMHGDAKIPHFAALRFGMTKECVVIPGHPNHGYSIKEIPPASE